VIGPSQRRLPDNTQQSQETDIHAPGRIRILNTANERPQTHALERAVTGIGCQVSLFVCFWRDSPQWDRASSFMRFLGHTQRRITVGRTPLDEWSARCKDLYLTTHNTHNRQTSMPPAGFEWPQTYASDRAATGIGC